MVRYYYTLFTNAEGFFGGVCVLWESMFSGSDRRHPLTLSVNFLTGKYFKLSLISEVSKPQRSIQ